MILDGVGATAHRVDPVPGTDVFASALVRWLYLGTPVWTLRAVLTPPPPHHPNAPHLPTTTPPDYGFPRDGRMPVRIRRRDIIG